MVIVNIYPSCIADVPINNQRYACLQFEVKDSTLLHGFAGYFEAVLYKDIMLSELLYQHMCP